MYKVFFTRKSEKELNKLSHQDAKNVVQKLLKLTYPFPDNFDIQYMSGFENYFRLRVGTVRVLIELDKYKKKIWIRKIKYRGAAYKN